MNGALGVQTTRLFDVDISLNRIEFGGAVYLQAIVRDITGRKQVEDALRASESRFRLLIENAPCVHPRDRHGRQDKFHEQGRTGHVGHRAGKRSAGISYLDAVDACDRDRIAELLARAYAGETSHFEFKSGGQRGQDFQVMLCSHQEPATAVLKS